MPFYEVTDDVLTRQEPRTFSELGLYERADIQRLLRDDISPLGDDLLVISEEFGGWRDAHRRIDLLALDRLGRLVVIELKRTEDGGHMDLQALRYAAMVSSMDFTEVLAAFEAHRAAHPGPESLTPREELEAFLDSTVGESDPAIATEVRIVLVSADFGREITTAVLWLNGFEGMDIRCVRLIPYQLEGKVFIDIDQVIPLAEAADYQVRVRRKEAERERAHTSGRDLTRFQVVVDGVPLPAENKRNAIRVMIDELVRKGIALESIRAAMPPSKMRVLDGLFSAGPDAETALMSNLQGGRISSWFVEHPYLDAVEQKTYILSKEWGTRTEQRLGQLENTFPASGVAFQRANEDG